MARGDEGWEGEKMERKAGGGRGRGGILGENRREGKGKFPRAIRAPIREGRRETRGGREDKGMGEGRGLPHVHPSLIRIKYIRSILV